MRRALLGAALFVVAAAAARADEPSLRALGSVDTGWPLAGHRVADIDGDGKQEIVLLAADGRVGVVRRGADGALTQPLGDLVLPHPARSLVGLGRVAGDDRLHLLVASPDGVDAYPSVPGDGFAVRPLHLATRARFTLRVGVPRFAAIARELNDDDLTDVVVPHSDRCEIWLQAADPDGGAPRLERAASVAVDVRQTTVTRGSALTDVLESAFSIPDVRVEDVNGDGRRDLVVVDGDVRAFHLQRDDGSFSVEPDVSVDLELFRDTTPEADVRLGRTLAGSDDQRYESRDLDGDGIPDHVIAHRRKVWVFMGGPAGPQFQEPVAILKTAEDVTTLMLVRVDDDARPDLVLVRLRVPTAAAVLKGLLTEWNVDLSAVGYRGRAQGGFDTTAAWNGELTVRLPALLGVIRDPDALIRRFEDASRRFGTSLTTDADGDGGDDVLLVVDDDDDAPRLDLWIGASGSDADDGERVLGHILFDDDDRTWTLDRMLTWLGDLAQRRAARLTGGRKPDGTAPLRADVDRRAVEAADLDGDGRHEIVVLYDAPGGAILDVVAWR